MYRWFGFAKKLNILNCINLKGNCVHYTYGLFRFAEKFNIQNYVNLTENCVHNMYGLPGFAKKIEYPELCKSNESTLPIQNV